MKKTQKTSGKTIGQSKVQGADGAGPGGVARDGAQGAGVGASGLVTMEEAIGILKTTRPTFYRWVRSGKLRGTKVGRQWRFTREDIERFVQGHEARIDLPADIGPLIGELEGQLKGLGAKRPEAGDTGKVAYAIRLMIELAMAMKASDIHIEGQEDGAQVRLRVGGVLHVAARFDLRLLGAVVEGWKALAAMDVREKALPQDGRILDRVGGAKMDLRVCCLPACFGESVVARVLCAEQVQLDLNRLPYAAKDRERIERWLAAPWGIVLATGPAGCGKTTTLYSCLLKVTNERRKVFSIEEPVEYRLAGVTQVQVNPKAGLTMERALRSVLRSDPDVIMVGEIRSSESMQLCFQAALTGHLVLSQMHTDEAAGALRRMMDLGSEAFMVADATKLIVAQRLVRRLCADCAVEAAPTGEQLRRAEELAKAGGLAWEELPRRYRTAVGCGKCGKLGYRGRTLMAETLEVTAEIAAALRRGAPAEELRRIAVGQGMTTLAADGVRRAAAGEVALAEVLSTVSSISY